MKGKKQLAAPYTFAGPVGLASVLLMSLILVSGVAYAWPSGGNSGFFNLEVTSMSEISGPPYAVLSVLTPLPTASATFKVGPFSPGDSVIISYTVKNTGSTPKSLSSLGIMVTPTGGPFVGSNSPIPSSLNPGASFSSTITVSLNSGVGNSYQGSMATISLSISGVRGTTSATCSSTVTSTVTKTVTTMVTRTVTKTITKNSYDSPLDQTLLWETTTGCTTMTLTVTSTSTVTHTVTSTKTVATSTCTWEDDCH